MARKRRRQQVTCLGRNLLRTTMAGFHLRQRRPMIPEQIYPTMAKVRKEKQQTESMDTEDGTQNNDKNNEQTPDTRKQMQTRAAILTAKNGYGAK